MLLIVVFYWARSLRAVHPSTRPFAFYSGAAASFRIPLQTFFSMCLLHRLKCHNSICTLFVNYFFKPLFLFHMPNNKKPSRSLTTLEGSNLSIWGFILLVDESLPSGAIKHTEIHGLIGANAPAAALF